MIENAVVINKIQDMLTLISPEMLPEIYAYLSSLPGSDDFPKPYEIANAILAHDRTEVLPGKLIDIITDLFELEIAEGNSAAMNDLGACYYEGSRGFKQDFEKAVHFYKMAAENGNRQAQENLGYCYYYGRDGEPDFEKAFHYFALGAFDGHLVSLYKIGDMYLHGLYVPKNEKEAFYIYMRCIETMADEAAYRLSSLAGPEFRRKAAFLISAVRTVCIAKKTGDLEDINRNICWDHSA